MRKICSLVLVVTLGAVRLIGADMDKAVEDDLDAIADQGKAGTKPTSTSKSTGNSNDDALAKIVLPEKPTKADVVKYLDQLVDEVAPKLGKRVRVRTDELEKMFDSVPSEFLREMLKTPLNRRIPMFTKTLLEASVNKRTDLDDTHRDLIMQYLPDYPGMIVTVARHGWGKGAEATIIKVVRQPRLRPSTEYVSVLAAYGTPKANAQLVELVTESSRDSRAKWLVELFKVETKGLDREELLKKAWISVQESEPANIVTVAPLAAKHGYLDALAYMAKRLNGLPNSYDPDDAKIRGEFLATIHQLVPDGGSEEKSLVKYVLANRTTLTFDKALKEYHVTK